MKVKDLIDELSCHPLHFEIDLEGAKKIDFIYEYTEGGEVVIRIVDDERSS